LPLDGAPHHAERLRGHAVLEPGEDLDVLARDHVCTRPDELATLQDQAPELEGEPVDLARAALVERRRAPGHARRPQPARDELVRLGAEVDPPEGRADAACPEQPLAGKDRGHARYQSSGGFEGQDHSPWPTSAALGSPSPSWRRSSSREG